MANKWKEEEFNILKKNHPNSPLKEMLCLLPGRTRKAITQMAKKLKVKKITPFEKYSSFIIRSHKHTSNKEIARKLNIDDTTVSRILRKNGLESNRDSIAIWIKKYGKKFIEHSKKMSLTQMSNMYKKSTGWVMGRYKHLGIKKHDRVYIRANDWSKREDDILIKNYPIHGRNFVKKIIPLRSISAICRRVAFLKLKRVCNVDLESNALFCNTPDSMYWTGYLLSSSAVCKDKKCLVLYEHRKIMDKFTEHFGLDRVASIDKKTGYARKYIKAKLIKPTIHKCCMGGNFSLNFIRDDELFIAWICGFIDRYHSYCGNVLYKNHTPSTISYCVSRLNLIFNTNIKFATWHRGDAIMKISKDDMGKICSKIKSLNIGVGEFWRQPTTKSKGANHGNKSKIHSRG